MTEVFHSLSDPGFLRLFRDFKYTAFRLKARQFYDVPYEHDEFARFLKGEHRGDVPGINHWIDEAVRPAIAQGKRMCRVHMVTEPLSDYVRFQCAWAYRAAVTAGEDVRIMPCTDPSFVQRATDHWLFDSSDLVIMRYENDGSFAAATRETDAIEVLGANRRRDAAIAASISVAEFARRYDHRFAIVGD
jgi:hypothetical protein